MKVAIPTGPKPAHIALWLEVNNDTPERFLVCPKCGQWFAHIDHLAPYHMERCWCEKCQKYLGGAE